MVDISSLSEGNIPDSAVKVLPTPGGPDNKMIMPFPMRASVTVTIVCTALREEQTFSLNNIVKGPLVLGLTLRKRQY